jgi:hypothetical protein
VIGTIATGIDNTFHFRRAVLQLDALAQALNRLLAQRGNTAHGIFTFQTKTRVHHAIGEIARIGKN